MESNLGHMDHEHLIYTLGMLEHPRQPRQINIPDLAFLKQLNVDPESHEFIGMVEDRPHNEVHTLYVVYI